MAQLMLLDDNSNAKSLRQRLRSFSKRFRALPVFSCLSKAWDNTVESATTWAGMADYAGIMAAPGVAMAVPMSHSLSSTSFRDYDYNYSELMRSISRRETAATPRTRTPLSDHDPLPRSFSTPIGPHSFDVGRIEEDSPCYFPDSFGNTPLDKNLEFQRSRSCSTSNVHSLNLYGRRNVQDM